VKQISFADFYLACRDRLTDGQLRNLAPHSDHYESNGTFWGMRSNLGGIWLDIVVGDIHGLLRLKQFLKATGIRYIGWACRKDSSGYVWALYWQAKIEDVGARYPDGEIAWQVTVDMQQTRRNKKQIETTRVEP
jgi:hypothetical protein